MFRFSANDHVTRNSYSLSVFKLAVSASKNFAVFRKFQVFVESVGNLAIYVHGVHTATPAMNVERTIVSKWPENKNLTDLNPGNEQSRK